MVKPANGGFTRVVKSKNRTRLKRDGHLVVAEKRGVMIVNPDRETFLPDPPAFTARWTRLVIASKKLHPSDGGRFFFPLRLIAVLRDCVTTFLVISSISFFAPDR